MQPDNKAAYEALKTANEAFRAALAIAADSPIPSTTWNEYGRAMELQTRAMDAIKPK